MMAVEQTRQFFLQRDGYLTDNPAIGPDLAQHYWLPGNSVSHDDTLRSLTGEGFNPDSLAQACNQTVAQAWREAQQTMAAAAARPQPPADFDLKAHIRVVDGETVLADNADGDERMCRDFAAAIEARLVWLTIKSTRQRGFYLMVKTGRYFIRNRRRDYRPGNEALGVSVQRTNFAAFDVVHPAVQA